MTPQRIQLSRKKGWRMPPNTVKVDRSTPYGNPFPGSEDGLRKFEEFMLGQLGREPQFLDPLRGKNIACWCPKSARCHADIILRLANQHGDSMTLPEALAVRDRAMNIVGMRGTSTYAEIVQERRDLNTPEPRLNSGWDSSG